MSNVDSLTGLKNRRYFDATKSIYDKPTTGVLFIDIDYFKLFNDNYGHLIGDQCIKQVAQAIDDNVRQGDLLARYGGEEFVILMDKTNPEVIRRVAQRIIEQVEELNIEHQASQYNKVTVSLGWSFYDDGNELDNCLHDADQALYKAKESGRNQSHPR